jgi:hypothetical protein
MSAEPSNQEQDLRTDVLLPKDGSGELLQRDYWGRIDQCRVAPAELIEQLRQNFAEFPPPELISFRYADDRCGALEVGEELDINIQPVGHCRVRVACRDAHSFTFATLQGHPEAGRVTFGAYRHDSGDVIFHIRSRARSGNAVFAIGYKIAGEAMQTNTWADFVATVARTFGRGVNGAIHAETQVLDSSAENEDICSPTFIAKGSD